MYVYVDTLNISWNNSFYLLHFFFLFESVRYTITLMKVKGISNVIIVENLSVHLEISKLISEQFMKVEEIIYVTVVKNHSH